MTFRRRQILGLASLALVALLGGAWLLQLDFARKISTNVLDLIPDGEGAPELTLVRQLAGDAEARTMFIVLTQPDGTPAPAAAALRLAALLAREPAFDQALALGDPTARDALGHELFEQRFALLFPRWLREREQVYQKTGAAAAGFSGWLADDAAAALTGFLSKPEALAFQEIIPADPLLLLPGAVARVKGGLGLVEAPVTDGPPPTLVWARLAASPFAEAGQGPAFRALARAAAACQAEFPGLRVADTGINRFAAASRARIEQEVSWLNALSLAAVLAVVALFVRRVHRGLHLAPVVLLAVLGAWVSVTAAFGRVHVLVFVVGSLLTGVAVDYGFYLFMQPPAAPDEDYWEKVRRLTKPLLASCLTTVAGFALLLFSELPFIRQLGVFVGAGLLCALAAAVVYFSTVRNPFLETRAFRGGQALAPGTRRALRRMLGILWLASLPGLALLVWRDDIRELEIPSPELTREDARIRAQFGDQAERAVYLTYGATPGEARATLEIFEDWLRTASGGRTETIGLSAVVPTDDEAAASVRFRREAPEFPVQLSAALERAGFATAEFAPFFAAYEKAGDGAAVEPALRAVQAKLAGPLALLLNTGRPLSWFVTLAKNAPSAEPPAALHTVSAGQLQSLNRLFSRYRQSALRLSLTGLAIVGTGVFLTYGLRDGVRIFAIPCGACLGLFGMFGWLGVPLNMFHLFGAFLGVCLTHNYSIFSATSAYRREPPPVSVRMSGLTTAASFGVLALSGIPVVRALGLTVALMVVVALVVIEVEHLGGLGDKP